MNTNARTFGDEAAHYYHPDGRPCYEMPKVKGGGTRKTTVADARKLGLLPSPTTILRILAKPQLETWKVEQGCLAVLTSPRNVDEPIDAFVYRVLHVEREQDQERDAAADEGTAIHDALELSMQGLEYDPKYRPHVEACRKVIDQSGFYRFSEKVLVGDGYAGRTDLGTEDDNYITVWDFKGCKKLPDKPWPEATMQVSAYAAALSNTGEKRVRCGIIYINRNEPGQIAWFMIDDWQAEYAKFKLLVRYWYLSNNVAWPTCP